MNPRGTPGLFHVRDYSRLNLCTVAHNREMRMVLAVRSVRRRVRFMKCMIRVIATTAALALAVAGTSYAQEAGGPAAGRWEVSAFPGGGNSTPNTCSGSRRRRGTAARTGWKCASTGRGCRAARAAATSPTLRRAHASPRRVARSPSAAPRSERHSLSVRPAQMPVPTAREIRTPHTRTSRWGLPVHAGA